jgi:hypothetical protein
MDLRITYGLDARQRSQGLLTKNKRAGLCPPVKEYSTKNANVPLPYLLVGRNHTSV